MSRIVYRLPNPAVTIAALELNEDIRAIEQIRRLLDRIDPLSVADETSVGRKNIRAVQLQVRLFERYATNKMRFEYLDPRRTKIERRSRKSV
jgi:hypothetical protein